VYGGIALNLCIIPARGGSKRIPKKNIKLFCGKPLIVYSIETAKKSGLFDKIVVSTDDEEIAKVAKEYGAEVQMRPEHLADDYAGSDEVFEYVISQNPGFEYACMIYATAPFLRIEYLKEGYEKLKNSNACASFSATTFEYPIQRAFKIVNGRCEMFDKSQFYKRSQDLEVAYHDAGQFYWKKIGCKSDDVFFGKDTIPIVIPRYLVQDIDTMEDFIRAEKMYQTVYGDKEISFEGFSVKIYYGDFDTHEAIVKKLRDIKKVLLTLDNREEFFNIKIQKMYKYKNKKLFSRPKYIQLPNPKIPKKNILIKDIVESIQYLDENNIHESVIRDYINKFEDLLREIKGNK